MNKNILLTRSIEQTIESSKCFLEHNFNILSFPVIKLEPLYFEINDINKYDWIIFTSVNSIKFFFKKNINLHPKIKIAVIGNKTLEELKKYNLYSNIIPKDFIAESLIEEFSKIDIRNLNILFPRALKARDILIDKLKDFGANIDLLPVYENKINIPENKKYILNMFKNKLIDYIVFTSPSTVRNFFKIIDKKNIENTKYISIGPITNNELLKYINKDYFVAEEFTIKGIIKKILSI